MIGKRLDSAEFDTQLSINPDMYNLKILHLHKDGADVRFEHKELEEYFYMHLNNSMLDAVKKFYPKSFKIKRGVLC